MLLEIILFFLLLFVLFYYYITKDFNYFKGQNIAVCAPSFPWGSEACKKVFTGQVNFLQFADEVVQLYPKEKVIGFYFFRSPRFMINDEALAKQVLIKDFEYFGDIPSFQTHNKYFNYIVANLKGSEWKKVRSFITGIFSANKLKRMLPSMQKCGQNFESHLLKLSQKDEEIDLKALSGDFTLDAIFAGVFGIENDNFNNPDNIFRRMALRMVGAEGYAARSTFATMINILLINTVPWLANDILKLDVMPSDALEFFADIVRKTYQQRLLSGESRNDLVDLLIEEMRTAKEKGTDEGLDFETMLVSNCVLFFSSGFSTSSDGISVVVHRLAINPEEQDKIYDEINEEIGDEEITLERLQNLKYTEKFIQEALRCANLLSGLERECTKNYKIPGTDAVVKKGQTVVVYTPSIQFSEDNFVNAKEFDPENFDQSNLKNKFAHMVFGQGPRNCIGMRFGMFMMKLGIIFLVRKFRLHRGATMKDKLVYNMGITDFEGGVKVKLERR